MKYNVKYSLVVGLAALFGTFQVGADANADDGFDGASLNGIYVAGSVGIALLDNVDYDSGPTVGLGIPITGDADFDAGARLSGAVGMQLSRNLRGELEVAWRRNSGDRVTGKTGLVATGPLNGSVAIVTAMAQLAYDFEVGSFLRPYVSGGVGFAYVDIDNLSTPVVTGVLDDSDTVFAGQLGAGVSVPLTASTDLTAGYQLLISDRPNFTTSLGVAIEGEPFIHSIAIGIRTRL